MNKRRRKTVVMSQKPTKPAKGSVKVKGAGEAGKKTKDPSEQILTESISKLVI